jgi:DNA repair exonuclease SbcCD ATPase subunit
MQIPGLPAPPTDNYYKFKALAGLWLVAGTLAGVSIGSFEVLREIHEAKMQLAAMQIDESLLEKAVKQDGGRLAEFRKTDAALDRIFAKVKETNAATDRYMRAFEKKAADKKATKDELKEAQRQVDYATAQQDELQRVTNEARTELEAIDKEIETHTPTLAALRKNSATLGVVVEWIKVLFGGLVAFMIIGSVVMTWGLRLAHTGFDQWRSLQKLQDDILRQQLSSEIHRSSPPNQ